MTSHAIHSRSCTIAEKQFLQLGLQLVEMIFIFDVKKIT
eukprot:jgi/Antlo1/624/1587